MTRSRLLTVPLLFGLLSLVILTSACGTGGTTPAARVVILDPQVTVSRDGPMTPLEVSVFRVHGYTGDVRLSASDLPAGVSTTRPVVSDPDTAAQIQFDADATALLGIHRITITADGDGQAPITFEIDLQVLGRPGWIDTSFYLTGTRATTVIEPGTGLELDAEAAGLEVQFDDRIVVVGTASVSYITPESGRTAFIDGVCLARYLPDGALDPSFGSGGFVTTRFEGKAPYQAVGRDVIESRVGNLALIVVGSAVPDDQTDQVVLRYLPDGSLDPTFGTGGIVMTDFGGEDNQAYAVAEQRDGKIVVAGWARGSINETVMSVTRYNVDGTLDLTFGPGGTGYRHQAVAGLTSLAKDVEILSDGSILVVGSADIGGVKDAVAMMKLDPAGNLVTSFGIAGEVVLSHSTDTLGEAVSVVGDSPIVAGARVDQALLAFYDTAGLLDPSFGTAGISRVALAGSSVGLVDLLEHGPRVRGAGEVRTFADSGFDIHAVVIGYEEDGLRDFSFGGLGDGARPVRYELGEQATCVGIERQRDGRLIIAGTSGGVRFGIARLWP